VGLEAALAGRSSDPHSSTLLEEKLQKDEDVHTLSLAKDNAEEAYNDCFGPS
jgi:hypothetical protein